MRYGSSIADFHIGNASQGFVSNVRRLLQVKSAVHYENGYKSGSIAKSRLYRVGLPPIDNGDWNGKIFRRKTQESDVLDTAILVLTDWSGSMGGSKSEHAAKATALVNEAFANVLRIPVEILAFTSGGSRPIIGVIKPFEKRVTSNEIATRFYSFLAHMNGNNDADSLAFAYSRILKRKEKRKVLIVMSDGSPADGIGDPYYALKRVVEQITNERRVNLYGLGIMDNNVERFYPNHHVIEYGESIEQSLIELLGKALS